MKINKKLHSVALASAALILFLILVSSTAAASITETRITTHGTADNPAIYDNTVVWQDTRNVNYEIYTLGLSNKKETSIPVSGSVGYPSIYGNKIVYLKESSPLGNIYMYDLATKKETMINNYPNYAIGKPVIYGNIIVWEDKRNYINSDDWNRYNGDIYMYDLKTMKETKIAYGSSPSIYGNKIVWHTGDGMDPRGDIYMYDVSSRKTTQISHSGSASFPNIYGNKIVWEDSRNGNLDIYMCDLSTKKESQLTSNTYDQMYPAMYGNNIVWEDGRNRNLDIYAYDLNTHQQIHTTEKSYQMKPVVYGNKVVWIDDSDAGNPDVYMGTISYLPVAAFTTSPTTGKHPLKVQFTDKSTDAYYWSWNFGDKSTSTVQNPTHTYTKAGKYTVSLMVKNAAGSNTKTMSNYITVK
jgi:FOG: PKD repeat